MCIPAAGFTRECVATRRRAKSKLDDWSRELPNPDGVKPAGLPAGVEEARSKLLPLRSHGHEIHLGIVPGKSS